MTTSLSCNNPVKISTLDPFNLASTTWPPVTFENVALLNKVGMNIEVFLNADAG